MDADEDCIIIIIICIAAVHALLSSYSILFDGIRTKREKASERKRMTELTPAKGISLSGHLL
jgi:hypothetical protein